MQTKIVLLNMKMKDRVTLSRDPFKQTLRHDGKKQYLIVFYTVYMSWKVNKWNVEWKT